MTEQPVRFDAAVAGAAGFEIKHIRKKEKRFQPPKPPPQEKRTKNTMKKCRKVCEQTGKITEQLAKTAYRKRQNLP